MTGTRARSPIDHPPPPSHPHACLLNGFTLLVLATFSAPARSLSPRFLSASCWLALRLVASFSPRL